MKLKEYADLVRNRNTPAVLLRQEKAFRGRRFLQSSAQLQLFPCRDIKTGQMTVFSAKHSPNCHIRVL